MADETKYWGKPADPSERECDWCGHGSKAKYAFPLYKKQKQRNGAVRPAQYIYSCERHKRVALTASHGSGSRRAA